MPQLAFALLRGLLCGLELDRIWRLVLAARYELFRQVFSLADAPYGEVSQRASEAEGTFDLDSSEKLLSVVNSLLDRAE